MSAIVDNIKFAINYDQLSSSLNHFDVDDMWIEQLQQFVISASTDFTLTTLGSEDSKIDLLTKSIALLNTLYESREQSIEYRSKYHKCATLLCDTMRICARNADGLRNVFQSNDRLDVILNICVWHDPSPASPSLAWTNTNINAFRCLINILFNCSLAFNAFCESSSSIGRLISMLEQDSIALPAELEFQCVKLLFLIAAQCLTSIEDEQRQMLCAILTKKLSSMIYASTDMRLVPIFVHASYRMYAKEICKTLNALKIAELNMTRDVIDVLESAVARILALPIHDHDIFSYTSYLQSYDKTAAAMLIEDAAVIMDKSLPPLSDEEKDLLDLKRNALNLAMHATGEFGRAIIKHNAISELCYFLGWQLVTVDKNKAQLSEDARVSILVPTLAVLTAAATDVKEARAAIKAIIFPNPSPQKPLETAPGYDASEEMMHARDAPPGTLRGMLIKLMLSLSHHIKRSASELMFVLCDEGSEEFVLRTGYGNAIALLQIKGLLGGNIPS